MKVEAKYIKTAFLISMSSVIASIIGLLNQSLFASRFGASQELDAYFTILSVPTTLSGAAPVILAGIIIPAFGKYGRTPEQRVAFASKFFRAIIFICICIVSIGFILSPYILNFLLPLTSGQQFGTLVIASRLLWVMAGLSLVAAYFAALHNSIQNFVVVALTSLLPNISILLSVLLLSTRYGTLSMPIGLAICSVLQVCILLPLILDRSMIKFTSTKTLSFKVTGLFKNSLFVFLSLLPNTAFPLISVSWASRLNLGSASYVGYSQSFAGFISVAIAYGLSTIALPKLVNGISEKEHDGVKISIVKNFNNIVLLGCVLSFFLIIAAPYIIQIVLQHGEFKKQNVLESVKVIRWYLLASIFISCMNFMRNVFYATQNYRILAIQSASAVIFYWLLAGICSKLFGVIGIGVSYAVAWVLILIMAISASCYNGKLIFETIILVRYVVKVSFFCALGAGSAWIVLKWAMYLTEIPFIAVSISWLVYLIALYVLNRIMFKLIEFDNIVLHIKRIMVSA